MKIETRIHNSQHTIIGFFKQGVWLDVTKHDDYFMGKNNSFWRVDDGSTTVGSVYRTKSEAMAFARKYLAKKKLSMGA